MAHRSWLVASISFATFVSCMRSDVGTVQSAVSGAAFTTFDQSVDGTGHCRNSANNCNIYDGKQYVWLNGGPTANSLGPDGSYFFAVLSPGGQNNPNDGAANNLSDDFDAYTNRTFTVTDGEIAVYAGSHDFDSGPAVSATTKAGPDGDPPYLRLAPYADTSNPGGVYIVAVCSLASGYPVDPKSCKYDAFKVQTTPPPPGAVDLTIAKDATPAYDRTFTWGIEKEVDKTIVKQLGGGLATFNFTITVTHDTGTDGNWKVTGNIYLINPNDEDVSSVLVTDAIDDSAASCVVTGGNVGTLAAGDSITLAYTCTFSSAPACATETNTATVTWDANLPGGGVTPHSTASFSIEYTFGSANLVDESVTVTDPWAGGELGTVDWSDPSPTTFETSKQVTVPSYDCVTYTNTATYTTVDTATTGSDSVDVTVCGPEHTGALTMGFWQNKNGQGIIKSGAAPGGVCASGEWLRQYAPFADLSATASCSGVATYVMGVIKAANASGAAMNAMLKAQMLATALDVFFSDPALGGNRIGAPNPIGGVSVDLTLVGAGYIDVSAAFGGATSMTVDEMLAYAASQSGSGGTPWYLDVKAIQELAKDAFDAINNQLVFAP